MKLDANLWCFSGNPTKILHHLIYQLILVQLPDHICISIYIYIYIFTYTYIHIALKVRILVFEYYLKHVTIDLPTKTTHQPPAADSPWFFLLFGFSRPRYQANHLGFCPPNLCNATTSPESRAWQYLELLGHRSNETMKVLGKIIGEVGGFCFFCVFFVWLLTWHAGVFVFCFLFVFFLKHHI